MELIVEEACGVTPHKMGNSKYPTTTHSVSAAHLEEVRANHRPRPSAFIRVYIIKYFNSSIMYKECAAHLKLTLTSATRHPASDNIPAPRRPVCHFIL